MQNEQRSSQPFIVVTNALTGASPGARRGGEEAGRVEVEDGARTGRGAVHLLAREGGEVGDVVGADDQIEVADAGEELLALLLRDAARDGEHETGVLRLERRELADLAPELLLGLLADAARVEDDEIGLLRGLGARPAVRAQHLLHAIGVVRVHLAAEGVDEVEASHCGGSLALAGMPGEIGHGHGHGHGHVERRGPTGFRSFPCR